MLTRLREWWMYREVTGDCEIGAAGDHGHLLIHTGAWFKRCIVVTVPRQHLVLLAEMIQESEVDGG